MAESKNWTLILPCAAPLVPDAPKRPKFLLTTPLGELLVARAAAAIPAAQMGRVIVSFTREVAERYKAEEAVKRAFAGRVECVVLEAQTQGPAQTVQEAIARANVTGPVCIKDADCFFDAAALPDGSFIAVADIRAMSALPSPGHKSYVRLNEQNFVAEMTEKDATSNLISAGAYGFADAALYSAAYAQLMRMTGNERGFVSHVAGLALLGGEVFAPHEVTGFTDIGTVGDWAAYRAAYPTIVLDIDGVIFLNQSHYFPPFWGEPAAPIAENVAHLQKLQAAGAQFVFMTARPEQLRGATLAALEDAGLRVHALVMGCHHGPRYLVNDYAPSNPYPSALAVNLRRNQGELPALLLPEHVSRGEEL